ncbi:hypothetical protein [Flavobacterium faecale]|nr:hypothetical protein [Flavobacterium faecale]
MAKIYSKKNDASKALKPKKEIVSFLINYSKALTIIKGNEHTFEIISN